MGFGRGTFGYEYGGFGVDEDEAHARFRESVRIVQGLWTTPEFSHEGEFYTLNKLNLVPPPLQSPHPPIYIAASYTQATLEFLVRNGYKLCIAVVQDTQQSLDLCKRYLALSADAGREPTLDDVPFFRYFYVAETEEQAREDTAAHVNWILDIMQWRRIFSESSEVPYRIADWRSRAHRAALELRLYQRQPRLHRHARPVRREDFGTARAGRGILRLQFRDGRHTAREGDALDAAVRG